MAIHMDPTLIYNTQWSPMDILMSSNLNLATALNAPGTVQTAILPSNNKYKKNLNAPNVDKYIDH